MGRCVDPALFTRSGRAQVQALIDGEAPLPPIHYLTGMAPTEVAAGTATFTMPASDWLLDSRGAIDLAMLSILADGPLGSAFQSMLAPMTPYTTAELSMNYLQAPLPEGAGQLVARAAVIGDSGAGLTEVRITDDAGILVAQGTCRCIALPPVGAAPARPAPLPAFEPDTSPSRIPPYRLPAMGEGLPPNIWKDLDGREILEQQIAGDLPLPPAAMLTGRRPVAVGDGWCSLVLPATEWLYSPFPRVEGGVIAMLADAALGAAAQSTVPAGGTALPLDVKVNFLRPVVGDGSLMRADAEVVHRGRTVAVSRCQVLDGAGRPVALASGTAAINAEGTLPDAP